MEGNQGVLLYLGSTPKEQLRGHFMDHKGLAMEWSKVALHGCAKISL